MQKSLAVLHHNGGPGNNMLCMNGSAHAHGTANAQDVTCPACKHMLRTGCSSTEAIKAWETWPHKGDNW